MTGAPTLPPNLFKRKLASRERQVGLWLAMDSLFATEIVAGAGYDWLLLDMEHTGVDVARVIDHLRAAAGGTAEVVVRIPWNEPVVIKRLLDVGARSIMVPFVQSAQEAQRAVAATRYAPHGGMRGTAGNTRSSRFNRITSYFDSYRDEQCIVAQIETPVAIEAIEAIGAVDGIDALFIGPNDLASAMGHLAKPGAPEVRQLIAHALPRIRATGKAAGILNFLPDEARAHFAQGFDFVAVGSDAAILARRSEALFAEVTAE
jgi:4-hydroxy-2-oxoheptanedioate aldolase